MSFGSDKFFLSLISDSDCLCVSAGYESGAYRTSALSALMMEALPEFALSFDELAQLKHENAVRKIREAAQSLYDKAEDERGEPGELLLHLLLRDFFGTVPVASKIYFTDSTNSNVKGFDIVQAKPKASGFQIFVGESKLSKSFDSALSALKDDVEKHLRDDFLRKEFLFVGRKIPKEWPHRDGFLNQIDSKRTLDQIKEDLTFVAFAAYECEVTKTHAEATDKFKSEVTDDLVKKLERTSKSFGWAPFNFCVILLPIFSKKDLRASFDHRLKSAKEI